jgi:hypothetical protein
MNAWSAINMAMVCDFLFDVSAADAGGIYGVVCFCFFEVAVVEILYE